MSKENDQKAFELSASDKDRADRLYEEIFSRLDELTLIVGRVTGARSKRFGQATIVRRRPNAEVRAKVEYFFDEDGNCIGVYDYDAGLCYAC